jgi:RNA polymerase sigma-70 factor (ECF subfamily)
MCWTRRGSRWTPRSTGASWTPSSLEALLTPDAVSLSDGNGVRGCARVPVVSAARVARLSSHQQLWRDAETEAVAANGRPGVLVGHEGRPVAFLTLAASKEGIHQVLWVFNPAKIAAFLGSRSRGAVAVGRGSPGTQEGGGPPGA